MRGLTFTDGFLPLPLLIKDKAEDGLPFEQWDGSTIYGTEISGILTGSMSKSPSSFISTAGPGSLYSLGPFTLEEIAAMFWRVARWDLSFNVDASAAQGGAEASVSGSPIGSAIQMERGRWRDDVFYPFDHTELVVPTPSTFYTAFFSGGRLDKSVSAADSDSGGEFGQYNASASATCSLTQNVHVDQFGWETSGIVVAKTAEEYWLSNPPGAATIGFGSQEVTAHALNSKTNLLIDPGSNVNSVDYSFEMDRAFARIGSNEFLGVTHTESMIVDMDTVFFDFPWRTVACKAPVRKITEQEAPAGIASIDQFELRYVPSLWYGYGGMYDEVTGVRL